MSRLSEKVKRWMEDSRPIALAMIAQRASYRDAMSQLMFFYMRGMVAKHSRRGRAALAIEANLQSVLRYSRPPRTTLTDEAVSSAETWAGLVVVCGATFREAKFVFRRVLIETAVGESQGNRAEAARLLKVHRNTTWNIPSTPADLIGQAKKGVKQ